MDYKVKIKEKEKRDKYLDLAREQKQTMGHEVNNDTNCNRCTCNDPQRLEELKVGGRAETIKTIALLRSDRILETWRDMLSLKL